MDAALGRFAEGIDAAALPLTERRARLRLRTPEGHALDVVLRRGEPARTEARRGRADAVLTADPSTWQRLVARDGSGMDAFRRGHLKVRGNLHLAVAVLSAGGALRFFDIPSDAGPLSAVEAGEGPPVLLVHGLGASKLSMLSTLAALAPAGHRAIALDLPGFGDSAKPLPAGYSPQWFARTLVSAMDALGLDRADVVGNSLGGRVALELGLAHRDRVGRLGLLCPSLAWRDKPLWAQLAHRAPARLGLIQPAPRVVVDAIVRRAVPGSREGWTAAGVDEFLRGYLTPRGRQAFYLAAQHIIREDAARFWKRLERLEPEALFVWGRADPLVPIAFARHVSAAVPHAQHLELHCGHVPQLEAPEATHRALQRFLAAPLAAAA